ncbi:MAG TPA: TadE/TadG family type IV pilus assembly protein [Nocardioidaceae bacterium]|nr:TadE/TadG family type IV pilus assembly protein [Nocardioidaceae bacterium]
MRRRRDERAASTLEMAIIAPVFLLLIFGIVEFGLWMYARNVVTLAAREGASYLRVSGAVDDPSGWQGAAEDTATAYAEQVGLMTNVTATATSDDEQATVRVCGEYAHPMGMLSDAPVCQTVIVEIEQFEPDPGEPE